MSNHKLNNEHFQPDLEAWETLNDFDETITQTIPSHDAYVKAKQALTSYIDLDLLKELAQGARRITHDGCVIALDHAPQPDKPGTVRRPGTSRQTHIHHRKARWSSM